MRMAWVVAVFAALVVLLGVGLTLNPREVPSPLIGKPAPAFELPLLHAPDRTFSQKEMLGKAWVLNVWASWCPPCLVEHPEVTALAKSGIAPVVGLNYKDAREDALRWLQRNGDPYQFSVQDTAGRIGMDYGVYGVPETFFVDRHGRIRVKHVSAVTDAVFRATVERLLAEAGP